MNTSIYHIELLDLLWVILIGYVLTYIFSSDSSYLVILILSVMLVSASVIAVRYQMMVMLMIFGSAGISVAIYLLLLKKGKTL